MKKLLATVTSALLAPSLRPIESRALRALGIAVCAWLGVKYA